MTGQRKEIRRHRLILFGLRELRLAFMDDALMQRVDNDLGGIREVIEHCLLPLLILFMPNSYLVQDSHRKGNTVKSPTIPESSKLVSKVPKISRNFSELFHDHFHAGTGAGRPRRVA